VSRVNLREPSRAAGRPMHMTKTSLPDEPDRDAVDAFSPARIAEPGAGTSPGSGTRLK